jgi:phosphoribosylformimino-5-aminoimidazole carboxamide ribotide isomerase
MIIYPALDLRGGKVVRLRHGDPSQQTTYSDDPLATAQRWQASGAQWLHVVNLDGALGAAGDNLAVLKKLASLGLSIQFGGGLRSLDDAAHALDAGASRIVLGTLAVHEPQMVVEAIRRFGPEAVVVALDAKDETVVTHGWQTETPWRPSDLGQRFAWMGLRYILFTDIRRDGDLSGANVEATAALAAATGLRVIASGGVATLDDIRALSSIQPPLDGVVIGRALYSGEFTLEDALAISQG